MVKKPYLMLILIIILASKGFIVNAEEVYVYPKISIIIHKIELVDPVELPMEWTQIDWHYYVKVQDGGLIYENEKNYTFWYDSNRLMNDLYEYEVRNKVIKITLTLFDEDYPSIPDQVDISSYPNGGIDNSREFNRTCQFVAYYDISTDTFVQGDQVEIHNGYYVTSGEFDGSYYVDENDANLWFKIYDNYELPVSYPGNDIFVALGKEVYFNGSDSTASEGSFIDKYEWDFDDDIGFRVRDSLTSYTFYTEGVYIVRLRVTDSMTESDTGIMHVYVGNAPPDASFTYSPSNPSFVDIIQFNDTSVDHDGAIKSWFWDFGDGNTSIMQNPTHTYISEGVYTLNLTVTDNKGISNSKVIQIPVENKTPYADFEFTPDDPIRGKMLQFLDSSEDYENGVLLYKWDFGDGGTSSDINPFYSYTTTGDFVVTLTVEDEDGNIDIRQKNVSIKNRPPIADFQVIPPNPSVESLVQFLDLSSDPEQGELIYEWKLGDGSFKYTQSPTHYYLATGTYDVKLTVTDDEGEISDKTLSILVIRKYDLIVNVKDALGSPIIGCEATVFKSGVPFTVRNTDNQGAITLYDIPEGNYRVVVKNMMIESDMYITVDRDITQTLIVTLSIITAGVYGGVLIVAALLFKSKDKIMNFLKKS